MFGKSKSLSEAQGRLDALATLFAAANLDLGAITATGDKHALRDAINTRLANAVQVVKSEAATDRETLATELGADPTKDFATEMRRLVTEAQDAQASAEGRSASLAEALVDAGVYRSLAAVEAVEDKDAANASAQIADAIRARASTVAAEQVGASGLTPSEQVEQDVTPDAADPEAPAKPALTGRARFKSSIRVR